MTDASPSAPEVNQDERHALALGTAGHIDHGKTALVRALTGVNTDRLPQEQQRGMTIDLGFAHLDLPHCRLGIIDVPGHDRFIRNMLAGATGIDMAMLVIAADDSVKPQTREHLAILETLGVKRGLIALTKIDRAEEEWIALVEDEVRELVRGTFLADAPIMKTSVVTNDGIDELRDALNTLAGDALGDPMHDRPFRLAIDRSFVLQGLGTVVTGTVAAGTVRTGDRIELQPGGVELTVRALHSHGASVEFVRRGQRAAVNLPGIHHSELRRGQVLAEPGTVHARRRLTLALDCHADAIHPIRDRSTIQLHLGTDEVEAVVRVLTETNIEPGTSGLAQVICREPVAVIGGQAVVVRMQSPRLTLGGGRVVSTSAPRIRRSDTALIQAMSALDQSDAMARARLAVQLAGTSPWSDGALAMEIDVADSEVASLRAALIEEGTLVDLSSQLGRPYVVSTASWDALRAQIAGTLLRLHDADPMAFAFERSRVRRAVRLVSDEIFDAAVRAGLDAGELGGSPTAFGHAERQPRLTKKQKEMRGRVLGVLQQAALSPPSAAELAQKLGGAQRDVSEILEFCAREGSLIHMGESMYLTPESEQELHRCVREALAASGELTMSAFRDACSTTRKYAVVYAGYLDRLGVTRRVGDVRVAAD